MSVKRFFVVIIALIIVAAATAGVYVHYGSNKNDDENGSKVKASANSNTEEEKKRQEEEKKKAEEEKKKAEEKARLDKWKTDMEAAINSYLGSNASKVGMVYYDLTFDQKIAINEEKVFTAASTVKVQINMLAYDWVKQGKLKLDETMQYINSDYEGGTGLLQGMDKSKPFPIQMLLDYSIKYSDNIATHMLQRRLGGAKAIRQMANELVGTNTDIEENKITAEQEFRLLKKLYENREDENYAHLLSVMKDTTFHDRIDKYLPHEICAHKIGNYENYTHDVAIVFTEKPYILVVYTQGLPSTKEKPVEEIIAGLSKLIYDEQLKK